MTVNTSPIRAELISVWQEHTVMSECLVDRLTGAVTVIENPDEEEHFVQTLIRQSVKFGTCSFRAYESESGVLTISQPAGLVAVFELITTFDDPEALFNVDSFAKFAGNPAANTMLSYEYRDGANYKTGTDVVFPGAISVSQLKIIEDNLLRDEGQDDFLPKQVDLTALCPDEGDETYDDELDHCVHTITEIKLTLKVPDDQTPITDFVNKFAAIGPEGWDMQNFGNLG
jgi:hypothetical protein